MPPTAATSGDPTTDAAAAAQTIGTQRQPPPRLVLRGYQQEAVDHAMGSNTVVSLPSGTGKTLVAVECVSQFLQMDSKCRPVSVNLL